MRDGGGGGSRTRVRKAAQRKAYMLIRFCLFRPAGSRTGKRPAWLARESCPAVSGGNRKASPQSLRLVTPYGRSAGDEPPELGSQCQLCIGSCVRCTRLRADTPRHAFSPLMLPSKPFRPQNHKRQFQAITGCFACQFKADRCSPKIGSSTSVNLMENKG